MWLFVSLYQGSAIFLASLFLFETEFLNVVAISFSGIAACSPMSGVCAKTPQSVSLRHIETHVTRNATRTWNRHPMPNTTTTETRAHLCAAGCLAVSQGRPWPDWV